MARLRLKSAGLAVAVLLLGGCPVMEGAVAGTIAVAQTGVNPERKAEVEQLLKQGDQWLDNANDEQNKRALQGFQKALEIARAIPDRLLEGKALSSIGEVYAFLNEPTKAIEYAQQGLEIARELSNRELEGMSLSVLGGAYTNKNSAKALLYQQQALPLVRELQNRSLEIKVLRRTGNAYSRLKQYQKALEFYQASLALAEKASNYAAQLDAWVLIADASLKQDSSPEGSRKAIDQLQHGLKIAQEHGYELKVAQILNVIGGIYKDKLDDSKKALEFYQQELRIAGKIKNNGLLLNALLDIAQSSYNLAKSPKEYQEVISFAERGLKLAQELKNYDAEARAFAILGLVQQNLKNYKEAIS